MTVLILCVAFAGCSSKDTGEETVPASTQISTEGAKIKAEDAINYIEQSYTPEELGLADVKEDYSLMVASNGIEYNGNKYIKVVANIVTQNDVTSEDGERTFSMKGVGEYLISFDGKEVLMRDMSTNKYSELENKVPDYSAKGENTATTEAK
ncbi:MAG: hypothetical protein NC397_03945 [Clostridium sp.]|nr:hypothetical protein [Clostridium sp.]